MRAKTGKLELPARSRRLNLALQGGGAHGAFTWGALDRLLENPALAIDGISGTSAGAVNAVAVAAGLLEGGAEGARACLRAVWTAVSQTGAPGSHMTPRLAYAQGAAISDAVTGRGRKMLASGWSPYDLNPLNINPLRDILLALIDFEKLRSASPVELFIAATEVTSGRSRIFRNKDISVEAVLASACLPTLFPAVRVGRFHYWDGAFSANPDLTTLIRQTGAGDTLLIQIAPDRNPDRPDSSDKIAANISRLTFNQPLRSQVEKIEMCRRVSRVPIVGGRDAKRLGRHRFHLIDGSRHTVKLRAETKARPDWPMIENLRDQGRAVAEDWLSNDFGQVGRRSTTDLYRKYFTDPLPFD